MFNEELPADCLLFLRLYVETRGIAKASKLMGIPRNKSRAWCGNELGREHEKVPGFEEALEAAVKDIQDQNYELLGDISEKGLREQLFDAEGKLKHTRFRQSEGLIKMNLMALDPDRYAPERAASNNVVIVLNERVEGGWKQEDE